MPNRARLGQFREFRAIPGPRGFLPCGDGAVVLDFIQSAEHRLAGQVVEFLAAQIIVAPLHVADAELSIALGKQRPLQRRDVFEEELLLQVLRSGRDDDALARADHRQEICQRFSGPGTGLDNQVTLLFERLFHGLRHLQLPAAKLVGGVRFREQAARREELVERESRRPSVWRGHGMG